MVKIENSYNPFPMFPSKKVLFEAEKFWSIYDNKNSYIIYDCFNSNDGGFSRVGVFSKEYTEGKIFIKNHNFDKQNSNIKNPLSYPIGPVLMSNLLAGGKGIFLHASGVKTFDDKGYLFCGESESGKSTIAKLWRDNDKITILNDDRIIIREKEEKFYIYGTPWYTESEFISK